MFNSNQYPALLLNADYRPLNLYPLSLLSFEDAIKGVYEETHVRVADYDAEVSSPSTTMKIPSVVALKQYVKMPKKVAFTRFNVFLRDRFRCQYCGEKDMSRLTYDHVIPQCDGGQTTWTNTVACCTSCNTRKDNRYDMKPLRLPIQPTFEALERIKREFPPHHLHESWLDYAYWDVPLEA